MPKEERTPVEPLSGRGLGKRVSDLEYGQGRLMGEVSKLWAKLNGRDSDRPSEANISVRPTQLRMSFRNFKGITIVMVIAIIVGGFLGWLVFR